MGLVYLVVILLVNAVAWCVYDVYREARINKRIQEEWDNMYESWREVFAS